MNIRLNKDNSEKILYDEAGIPIYIREGYLSAYPDYRALCHWHEDIEFIHILDGKMSYYINGKSILLKKGDSLMVNSGRLHYGYSQNKEECHFYCIILHPSLITTNKKLIQKYITTITQRNQTDYLLFYADKEIAGVLQSMYDLKRNTPPAYELEVIGLFLVLWNGLYKKIISMPNDESSPADVELQSQRQMVSYVYRNYSDNITLDEIAAAGNVCRSKCCRIFKKYVGHSPMDFVNAYRLECSQYLLQSTLLSITEICVVCGFKHLSYFSKQFQEKYGCTPREYRKRQKKE